ncbi:MAG: DnaD domain protein [Negativicutes bacterium]|nr:DnaD domain protein [Negativicutes bacterium]
MINPWCRLWNDMPSDPKWRTIAKVSGQRIGDVIAVFNFLMVNANTNATERGRTHNFNPEDIASALDIDTDQIVRILEAMEGRVIDNGLLSAWKTRQPIREDNSAERSKVWRLEQKIKELEERLKTTERDQTQPNAEKRPEEDKEVDKEINNDDSSARADEPVDNPEQIKAETLKVVVNEYQNEIGLITPTISAELIDMVDNFPRDWIIDAVKGAAKQNARKISYIRGTLNNWQVTGKTLDPPPRKNNVVHLTDDERAKKYAKADCPNCHGNGYYLSFVAEEMKVVTPEDQWVQRLKCSCWSSADKFG